MPLRSLPLLAALLLALRSAAPAQAASLRVLAREADAVVVASLPERSSGDRVLVVPERVLKRTDPLPTELAVTLPASVRAGRVLLFLAPDEAVPHAFRLLDVEGGVLPLDGTAGAAEDLLAAIAWTLDPPEDEAVLAKGLAALAGRSEPATILGLETLLERPDLVAAIPPAEIARIATLVRQRRISPEAAALALELVAATGARDADVLIVDVVASEAPDVVVEAAARAMPVAARPGTGGHLLHALGGAPDAARPGLLRLIGSAGARELLPQLHEHLASSRQAMRLAALAALTQLRDPASAAVLEPLLDHADEATRAAARRALESVRAARAAPPG